MNAIHEIRSPQKDCIQELTQVARQTFMESHHASASKEHLSVYLNANYTEKKLLEDIQHAAHTYRVLYHDGRLIGFSKIVMNHAHPEIKGQNITKMERIYVLEAFHGKGLGLELYKHNLDLVKENKQQGIWLYTWTGNERAIAFYKKMGFEVVGRHDFKISEQHSNPNHLMWKKV